MADYPDAPGFYPHAPETSREAAESVADAAKSREAQALRVIRMVGRAGLTADEVAGTFGWDRYSARPRLSALRKQGKIVDSGHRRSGVSGRRQAVWVAPEYAQRQVQTAEASR